MDISKIRVFVCVPAVGKTYLTNMDSRFVDMDNVKCSYKYGLENATDQEKEFLKGNRGKKLRNDTDEFMRKTTIDYINNTNKILLFAPNPAMVQMICDLNIPYCLVYHSKDCVEEIRERMRARGNQENFINEMLDPIDEFYKQSCEDVRPAFKIELFKGEYLADKILPIFNKENN